MMIFRHDADIAAAAGHHDDSRQQRPEITIARAWAIGAAPAFHVHGHSFSQHSTRSFSYDAGRSIADADATFVRASRLRPRRERDNTRVIRRLLARHFKAYRASRRLGAEEPRRSGRRFRPNFSPVRHCARVVGRPSVARSMAISLIPARVTHTTPARGYSLSSTAIILLARDIAAAVAGFRHAGCCFCFFSSMPAQSP